MDKSVITLAVGKQVYIDMAVALARSFYVWNKDTDIGFYIATDSKHLIAKDVLSWVKIIELKQGELGDGFSPKLHLDKIAPTSKTLFIDSDCLIVRPLKDIFERMEGKSVSVVGGYINEGEWFGDVRNICKKMGLERMPKFNGGIYYLEKGEIANKVYQKARELEALYDSIGFVRLRNKPNDELLMSLAMAMNNQTVLEDDGTIMSDPQSCPGGYEINVIKGKSLLINPLLPDTRHRSWYPFHKVSPSVVHFLGYYTKHEPYCRESRILELIYARHYNYQMALLIATLFISIPMKVKNTFLNSFRPIYRLFFGYRKVTISDRV